MKQSCKLSGNTKRYLNEFYCILDEMIRGMTGAELSDSISYNFIVQMIPHHRAAIEMSKNILQYTTDISIQTIAERIITEQTKSIEDMESILSCCEKQTNSSEDICLYQRRVEQIFHTMFHEMEHSCFNNRINDDFMREMIPHHEGAVRFSKTTLQFDICEELVPILNAIITSQERGIRQMKQLLCQSGCC